LLGGHFAEPLVALDDEVLLPFGQDVLEEFTRRILLDGSRSVVRLTALAFLSAFSSTVISGRGLGICRLVFRFFRFGGRSLDVLDTMGARDWLRSGGTW